MKRFLVNMIVFLALFFLIVRVVAIFLDNNLKTHLDLKFDEVKNPQSKADIVVLGTSHSGYAVNPEFIKLKDYSVYNLSMGGCPPPYYNIWYKYFFREYYPKPKYIIYAVDWAMFDTIFMQRTIDADIGKMPLKVKCKILLNEKDLDRKALILNNFSIIKNPRSLNHVFCKGEFETIKLDEYKNGYLPRYINEVKIGNSPDSIANSSKSKSEFIELIDNIKKDGISIIFVNIPEYIPAWATPGIKENIEYLQHIADSFDIPFLKYNHELASEFNYDSTYFYDWIHVNNLGAEMFSKKLNDDLQSLIK